MVPVWQALTTARRGTIVKGSRTDRVVHSSTDTCVQREGNKRISQASCWSWTGFQHVECPSQARSKQRVRVPKLGVTSRMLALSSTEKKCSTTTRLRFRANRAQTCGKKTKRKETVSCSTFRTDGMSEREATSLVSGHTPPDQIVVDGNNRHNQCEICATIYPMFRLSPPPLIFYR